MSTDANFGHKYIPYQRRETMTLEELIQKSRQANIERLQAQTEKYNQYCEKYPSESRPQLNTARSLAFISRCNDDERAIKRCFEAVPGDPLDNVKGWRK